MSYNRGTLAEFTAWHNTTKVEENIPAEGKINYLNGILAPNNQRTTEYSEVVSHPTNTDDYIWPHNGHADPAKTSLSLSDVQAVGFIPSVEI